MTFKTRKISHRPRLKPFKRAKKIGVGVVHTLKGMSANTRSKLVAAGLIVVSFFIIFKVTSAAYHFISGWSPKNLLFAIGSDLKKDTHGYTNVLLLGDGGHKRDGADLIDTIMVASIDYAKNSVSLFSIPRDLYVPANKELGNLYTGKINEVYRNHKSALENEDNRFQLFKRVVGDIVNLDIQYYARVDFAGFATVVDSLGGIMVDVKNDIVDPFYPNETDNGYKLFTIQKGLQSMDGETALKFVRSRKTTSDFDRSARQQLVLQAIQQKALSLDVLTSTGTLKKVYQAIQENLNTDLALGEMVALGGFAKQMDHSRVVRKLIHDDPGQEGGLLYTPDRELYGGEFVLVPFGDNFDLIQKYTDLVFTRREFYYEPTVIEILNATKLSGIAREAAYQLYRFGLNVKKIDNYKSPDGEKVQLAQSQILFHDYTEGKDGLVKPRYQESLNVLENFVKGIAKPSPDAILTTDPNGKKSYAGTDINFSIILGEDYDVFLVK